MAFKFWSEVKLLLYMKCIKVIVILFSAHELLRTKLLLQQSVFYIDENKTRCLLQLLLICILLCHVIITKCQVAISAIYITHAVRIMYILQCYWELLKFCMNCCKFSWNMSQPVNFVRHLLITDTSAGEFRVKCDNKQSKIVFYKYTNPWTL